MRQYKFWGDITQEFGIDLWLVSGQCVGIKCEIELGAKLEKSMKIKLHF